MKNSNIEWCDHTANFWHGCFKVSPGCSNCYALDISKRFGKESIWGPPQHSPRELKKGIWKELPKWNSQARESGQRKRVFVQSMSDFFEDHPQVGEWRNKAMSMMRIYDCLDYQVLTKRPENVLSMVPLAWRDFWPAHVWIGTSVENQQTAVERIPHLLKIPAAVRFLSCEPLLGDLGELDLTGIHQVIAGGESGPNARPMHLAWVRSLRDQCVVADVPFFFKQWGAWLPGTAIIDEPINWKAEISEYYPFGYVGNSYKNGPPYHIMCSRRVGKKAAGRLLDGREWNEFPLAAEKE